MGGGGGGGYSQIVLKYFPGQSDVARFLKTLQNAPLTPLLSVHGFPMIIRLFSMIFGDFLLPILGQCGAPALVALWDPVASHQ